MSEGPSTFDPRYDVRFQRGYTPPPDERVPAPATDTSAAADPGAPPSVAPRTVPAHPVARPVVDRPVVDDPVRARSVPAEPVAPAESGPESPTVRSAERELDQTRAGDASARAIVTRWLWLVFGAAVAFVIAGTALYWSVVSRQNPFDSDVGGRDTTVEQIVTSLSPAVVQAGVLGMVGALLAWALLGGRDARQDRARS